MSGRRESVLILDFGSQTTRLIARRCRENRVFSRIVPHDIGVDEIRAIDPVGLIMSGGPASVYAEGAPGIDPAVFELDVPILAICYAMQLAVQALGGTVELSPEREFGRTAIRLEGGSPLFADVPADTSVWMSHGDRVTDLDESWRVVGRTDTCPAAAAQHGTRPIFGVQFHPEVTHTPEGSRMIENFLFGVCGAAGDWHPADRVEEAVASIRAQVGDEARVVCGLSGGVDSSVVALLCHRAVGDRLTCILVDNGLLRAGEAEGVEHLFRDHFHLRLRRVDASERFLGALEGVADPEEKRRRIGHVFIDVFAEEAGSIPDARFLAQGTLYPDVIESTSPSGGPSHTIKTHHNVGGLPDELGFELVEPLRELFKDEVRRMGEALGLPREICRRHPFPGPGLAVRLPGEVTPERVGVLQEADRILIEEIRAAGLYESIWQAFCVLLPVRTVGVMGDARTFENALSIRCVESEDGMTADWVRLPSEVLARVSSRIINEVRGVNRVLYDVSSKPPSTIEWE